MAGGRAGEVRGADGDWGVCARSAVRCWERRAVTAASGREYWAAGGNSPVGRELRETESGLELMKDNLGIFSVI